MRASPWLKLVLPAALLASACGSKSPQSGTGETLPPASAPSEAPPESPAAATATPEEAKVFAAKVDADLRKLWVTQSHAEWNKATNITPENEAVAAKAGEASMNYLASAIVESRRFDGILGQLNPATSRTIRLLRVAGTPAPKDPAHAKELAEIATSMEGIYGKGKSCDKDGKNCKDLGQLEDIIAASRNPKELQAAWEGWHSIARELRPLYVKFVGYSNEGADVAGFANLGEMWRSGYDMTPAELEGEVARLWGELSPFYEQLHCYTRRKLSEKYGKDVVSPTGKIPAHLLGNMWSQEWGNIFPLVEPYKGQGSTDVTPALKKQGYDHLKMVKLAEGFFVSLGLDPLPKTFWERSMFLKPADRDVVCHASAWDPDMNDDLRIKMCIKQNQEDLVTIHHELGHDYYFHYYYMLPTLFQAGAHDGFHEAIGDAIALSITPAHLKQVGLLSKVTKSEKATIDEQLATALDKVAFLPFAISLDKWRWDVFAGKVKPENYNAYWWEVRGKLQGIVPPGERSEADFDPGAKYHIPGNTPYLRYFLARILQFQFYQAMCQAAGYKGPLHECSFYGSKAAGEKLKTMLAMGASKPWPEALEALTGERKMSAAAMLEYFAPLRGWLAEQNKGQKCGW